MSRRSVEDALFEVSGPRARFVIAVGTAVGVLALILLVVGVVVQFKNAGQLDGRYWEFFGKASTWSFLLVGLGGTMASAASAAVIALAAGLVMLAGRLSRHRPIRWLAVAVIEFLRGTPALLLIYFCFLVLPPAGIKLNSYWMLSLPVGLCAGAVVAEVYRAGVLAVPRGQAEAAASLGMSGFQGFFLVVFPQAVRFVVPALVAQLVVVVKDTTFGYVVTYGELMQNAKVLIANYHSLVPVYAVVAVIYCLVNYTISRASKQLARKSG
jgi:His/Glu/Gln/Arg/opine family amino acid ABC transporter permease subunit